MGKNVSLFENKYDMQNVRTNSTLNIYCGTTVRDCKISDDAFIRINRYKGRVIIKSIDNLRM